MSKVQEVPLRGQEAWVGDVLRRYPAPPRPISDATLVTQYFLPKAWPILLLALACAAGAVYVWTLDGSRVLAAVLTLVPICAFAVVAGVLARSYHHHRMAIRSGIPTTGIIGGLRFTVDDTNGKAQWDDVTVEGKLSLHRDGQQLVTEVEFIAPWAPALRDNDEVDVLIHPRSGRPLLILGPVSTKRPRVA